MHPNLIRSTYQGIFLPRSYGPSATGEGSHDLRHPPGAPAPFCVDRHFTSDVLARNEICAVVEEQLMTPISISDCWDWFRESGGVILTVWVASMAMRVKWEAFRKGLHAVSDE